MFFIGSGTHPDFCPVGAYGYFPEVKETDAVKETAHCRKVSPLPHIFLMSWCLIRRSVIFTFT
jgi:hypothetical protein